MSVLLLQDPFIKEGYTFADDLEGVNNAITTGAEFILKYIEEYDNGKQKPESLPHTYITLMRLEDGTRLTDKENKWDWNRIMDEYNNLEQNVSETIEDQSTSPSDTSHLSRSEDIEREFALQNYYLRPDLDESENEAETETEANTES